MSKKKLLAICLPTYNRAKYLKMQLERFSSMPQELWEDISIFISDNCSTDETQSIGNEYCGKEGMDIVYHRNDSNIGMDGNFVTCFKSAETKYVWLLGDDDTILIERLPLILSLLKEKEIGVIHLGIGRSERKDYTIYKMETEAFLRQIGIWITFISSNIVNTKYVKEINFEKYFGTFFTLVPVYLQAMIKEDVNIMVNAPIFDSFKDSKRNGGYGVCTVFVDNLLGIFKEFVDKGMLSEDLYVFEKTTVFNFVRGYVVRNYIFKEPSNFKPEDTWNILYRHYGVFKVSFGIVRGIFGYVLNLIREKIG